MLIELRLWRSFVVLAEELNFRRAAERLGLSQPALTKQIQELEHRLGVTLFRREPRGVEPTEATDANLKAAGKLIAQAEALERAFRATDQEASDQVSLGALSYITRHLLPPALASAQRAHPGLQVQITDMTPIEAAGAAAEGRIDLGVALAPVTEPNLVARPLVTGGWCAVSAEDAELPNEVAVGDLRGQPLILFDRRNNPDLFDQLSVRLSTGAPGAEITYQVQDPVAGVEMAAHGLGTFLVASYALPVLPNGLRARPIDGLGAPMTLNLVWRRDRMRSALRVLIDAFLDRAEPN